MKILVLGNKTSFEREGAATLFLYLWIDGEVEHGIDTFVFFERNELQEFLEELPEMNIFDFVLRGSCIVAHVRNFIRPPYEFLPIHSIALQINMKKPRKS